MKTKTKKYQYFILNAEYGEIDEVINTYKEAFSAYQRVESPKTLYGVDNQGNISVIYSQG